MKKKVFLSIFVLLLFSISLPAQAIEGGNLAPGKNVVSIFLKMPDGSTGKCSGAVIYKYLILTAKHCLGITSSNLNGSGIGATVYYPGADTSKINAEKAMVVDVITTPGLQAGAGEGQIGIDIAFLIIDKNFPIPTNQQLATSELIQNWKLNSQSVYSYGYGVQANGNSLSIPKRMLQNFSPTTDVSTNQLTLKHPTRETFICGGDSGGPTYVEQNGVEYLIGPMSGTTLDSCKRDSLQIPATTLVTSLVNFNDLYERAKIRVAKFQPNLRQQITCVKGKLSKIVTGVNPKCPRGYKKKILDKPATNVIVRYPEALSVQKILDSSNFKNLNQQITAQWFFEDKNDVNAVYWTKLGLENALKLYGSLGFNLVDPTVFVPDSEQWLKDSIGGIGCSSQVYLDSLGWSNAGNCPDGKFLIVARSYKSVKYGTKLSEFEFQHVLAHEYFHQIQYSLHANQHYPIPIWMIEGAAHFFSSLAFYSWNPNVNYETHLDYLLKGMRHDYYKECFNISLPTIPSEGTWEERRCGYSKGSKASEYLVAKYGVAAYIQMLKLTQTESFENAFQSTTGQSLQEFYAEVEVFLKQQGWTE